jgi:hypothetical protein
VLLAQLVQPLLAKHNIQQVLKPQNAHNTVPFEFFLISCTKNTLRGELFEEEEQSTVTSHSNFYRCTKPTAGGASNSGRNSGLILHKQKCSVEEGISTSWK